MTADSETGVASVKPGCLATWTSRQKCLLFFTIFLAVVSTVLIAVLLYVLLTRDTSEKICLTKNCALTAATLVSAIETSFDPCDNFFKFACSNFIRRNPVPDNKDSVTTFLQYKDTYTLQIKDVIETHNSYKDTNVVFKAQETYHVCINTTYDKNEDELKAFKNFLLNTFGGIPLLEGKKWMPKNKSLEEIMGNALRTYSFDYMWIYLDKHPNDTSIYDIKLRGHAIRRPASANDTDSEDKNDNESDQDDNDEEEKEKEEEERTLIALQKYLKKLLILMKGGEREVSAFQIAGEIENVLELAKKLDNLEITDNSTTEDGEKIISIIELNSTHSRWNWFKIFDTVFDGVHKFKGDEKVSVTNLDAINAVIDVLTKSPRRTVTNLILWDIIFPKYLSEAGPEAEELYYEYEKEIDEDFVKPIRWEKCLNWLQEVYPLVISRLFINKYVDKKNKVMADEMIQLIQKSYKERILKSDWLDEETKNKAALKAESIERYVGYPDLIFDDKELEKEYEDAPDVKSTYFENFVGHRMKRFKSIWNKYRKNIKESEKRWSIPPLVINAFYSASPNSIWFPSGILQLPFFDEKRIAAINFGMIGAVIGHEIGHAFDDSGSNFDEKGDRVNWWTNSTKEMFDKKAQCFVKQYNDYCPEERRAEKYKCVDGQRTLGENLADNTGIIASFEAYKLWTDKHGKDKRLPGLEEYSPEQLFFISYGYLWCENLPADKWEKYKFDSHSPMAYRSVGALSNYDKFREAFTCSENSPMNRGSDSCIVW